MQRAASAGCCLWRTSVPAGDLLSRLQLNLWTRTFSSDSHDDFKPKVKEATVSDDISKVFEKDITSHKVFVYMKGVPDAPRCGFSNMVCKILDAYGVKYGARNVLDDADVREGIKRFSNWPTIPQVYVEGEFVGGADILHGMHQNGELEKLLEPIVKQQDSAKA